MVTVADVCALLDDRYPPELAESWDYVGLVCGDLTGSVSSVAFAVDCTDAVAERALQLGVDMLVTHHPLLFKPVTSVAAHTPKGRIIHSFITHGIALFAAHTNADCARPGVNDVLAKTLGITPGAPIIPSNLDDAPDSPACQGAGLGRIGTLEKPMTLREFVHHVGDVLPDTEWGVRAAGDPDAVISTVAVCSGAGDSLLDRVAQLGVDCYLTSDLRHHPVDEYLRSGGPAVVDTAHWASEFPWTSQVRDVVAELGVDTHIVSIRTDPWTIASHGH